MGMLLVMRARPQLLLTVQDAFVFFAREARSLFVPPSRMKTSWGDNRRHCSWNSRRARGVRRNGAACGTHAKATFRTI
jgi:hypothetical protein